MGASTFAHAVGHDARDAVLHRQRLLLRLLLMLLSDAIISCLFHVCSTSQNEVVMSHALGWGSS
jgi:hypothetical protein